MRTDTTEEISVAKESNDVGEKENVLNYAIGTESVQGNVTNSHPNTINETTEAHVEQDQREHLNEGKELPLEEKNDSEGHTHNSIVSRLTVDQLLDYVKKQNAKVKKLKMENDEFRSQLEIRSPELHSGQGFWRDIHNRPVWQKQLAQGVLHYFLQSISRPRSSLSQLRQAFLHWCRLSAEIKSAELVTKVMEASETRAQLEQRVVKLKTLLAKMHQSNQKNVEDTVLARKNQLEIALEYQQRMTQEEAEKQALEEQLRCLAFESALHSDMEFVIEKAAQQIAAKVGVIQF